MLLLIYGTSEKYMCRCMQANYCFAKENCMHYRYLNVLN